MNSSTVVRAPLPDAYLDPAFLACIYRAVESPGLVGQFDRLYGADLSRNRSAIEQMVDAATGKKNDDILKFMNFVHESVYLRVPDQAIAGLRSAAAHAWIMPSDTGWVGSNNAPSN